MSNKVKLYNSARYPTSIIIRGADELGIEIAKSLLEQGGYVIIVDDASEKSQTILNQLSKYKLLTILDYSAIEVLESELRRLDYVFYFQHKASSLNEKISSQVFLQNSNYLDTILDLSTKFESKFLLTTSIKAHQMNVANKQIDINYSPENDDRHSRYTELEIQRYAESLVKEYQEKVGLDARIIRLGIVLGRAFDPEDKSILYNLINSALKGQDLLIPGDGLDTDYYIHYLDAAYGLIKAQFALNTAGKIFSLSNEEQQSILSIAYKLLEIVPDAQDIKFDQDDEELPLLKLYKPAPNLSEIGWKPRISFDRALAQTIDEIKELHNINTINNYVDSQNKTISTDQDGIQQVSTYEPQDALAKLIAERKMQQNARAGSIILANKNVKEKERRERNKGFLKRVDSGFNNILFSLKRRLGFLKNMTVSDFFAWTLIFIALIIIYVVLIAPGVAFAKDIYQLQQVQKSINTNLTNHDYAQILNQSRNTTATIRDAQQRLSDLRYLFNITNDEQHYIAYQKALDEYIQLFEGLELSMDSLLPYEQYISSFNPQVTYRYADNSMLTVGSNVEYESYLQQIKNKYSSLKMGIDKANKAVDSIIDSNNKLPSAIRDYIGLNGDSLKTNIKTLTDLTQLYNYMPSLSGYEQSRNYLVIIQDNARYTSAGGEIAGYVLFQFRNGALKDIRIKSATTLNSTAVNISKEAADEIKLMASIDKSTSDITFKDLSLITNQKLFLTEAENSISTYENLKLDMTISVDLRYLESLISVYGNVNYKDTVFSQENLLDKINTLTDSNRISASRNEILVNLYAAVLERAFNNMRASFNDLVTTTAQSAKDYNFKFYSTDPIFSNLSITNPLFADESHSDYIMAGINYKNSNIAISRYPVNTIAATIRVQSDTATQKRVELSTEGSENLENNYFCVPSGSKQVDVSAISQDIISRTYTNDKICYTFIKGQQLKYNINYGSLPIVASVQNNIYKFVIYTNTGLSTNYDLSFDFDPALGRIEPVDTNFITQGGKYIYTGRSTGYKEFSFKIINNE